MIERRLVGRFWEYLYKGKYLAVNKLFLTKEARVSISTISSRLNAYFQKGIRTYNTIEELISGDRLQPGSWVRRDSSSDFELYLQINKIMPAGSLSHTVQ